MAMNNTQRMMGGVVLLCGGTLLAALLLKGKQELNQNDFNLPSLAAISQSDKTTAEPSNSAIRTEPDSQAQALSVDVATEQRLLAQQRLTRERAVAEQEAKAAEFLSLQQQAEAAAAQKAADENAAVEARRRSALDSSDNIPPQLNAANATSTKTSSTATANAGANNKPTGSSGNTSNTAQTASTTAQSGVNTAQQQAVQAQRQIEIQRLAALQKAEAEKKRLSNEIKVLEAKRKAAQEKLQIDEQKRKALEASQLAAAKQKAETEAKKRAETEAKKRSDAEEARRILEGDTSKLNANSTVATGTKNNTTTPVPTKPTRGWVVQVALAATQANADAMVAKLRAKGYNVTTSRTSKGVRVLVGANDGNDRASANATRQKITTDAALGMNSAWVMDWQPPKAQ